MQFVNDAYAVGGAIVSFGTPETRQIDPCIVPW